MKTNCKNYKQIISEKRQQISVTSLSKKLSLNIQQYENVPAYRTMQYCKYCVSASYAAAYEPSQ
jgi:hypothetical protein